MNNYSDNLLDAMKIVAQNEIKQLKFDKTIVAEITSIVDKAMGKYQVKYNGNKFMAYANDLTYKYAVGENVYVKVPEGNFDNKKFIENAVINRTTDLTAIYSNKIPIEVADIVRLNNINKGITSGKENDSIDLIESIIDGEFLNIYQKNYKQIRLQADIRTIFSPGIDAPMGDYGINIYANDNLSQPYFVCNWSNSTNIDPYKAGDRIIKFSKILSIGQKPLNKINAIELFCSDITYHEEYQPQEPFSVDILCENLILEFVDVIDFTNNQQYLHISPIYNNTNEQKELLGRLYSAGQLVKDSSWSKQWYVQKLDNLINAGWEIIPGETDSILSYEAIAGLPSFSTKYKLKGIQKNPSVIIEAEAVAPGVDKDLYLALSGSTLTVSGNDKNPSIQTYNWYLSTSNNVYRRTNLNTLDTSVYDFSDDLISSVVIIYCDVIENNISVAYLSQQITTLVDDITVRFEGQDIFEYDTAKNFSPSVLNQEYIIKPILNFSDGTTSQYNIKWIAPNGEVISEDDLIQNINGSLLMNLFVDEFSQLHFNLTDKYSSENLNNTLIFEVSINNNTYTFEKTISFVEASVNNALLDNDGADQGFLSVTGAGKMADGSFSGIVLGKWGGIPGLYGIQDNEIILAIDHLGNTKIGSWDLLPQGFFSQMGNILPERVRYADEEKAADITQGELQFGESVSTDQPLKNPGCIYYSSEEGGLVIDVTKCNKLIIKAPNNIKYTIDSNGNDF